MRAMVDFALTDENRLVQRAARAFAEAEILPHIREWDEKGEVHREVFATDGASRASWARPIPEAYGGAGMDYISFAILCEELERADTAFRVVQSVHVGLNSLALLQWGTEEQRQRWLVPQAKGEKLATFGLTEPGVGTDAGNLADDGPPRRRRPTDSTARRSGSASPTSPTTSWSSPRVDRSKKHKGVTAFLRRARHGRPQHRHAPRQARHPGRQHRAHQPRRRRRPRGAPHRRGGRGLPHRDERHRPGPLHGRGRGRRSRPGVHRRAASGMPTSARRSARRSASTSSSSSSSPRWSPAPRWAGCSSGAPAGSRTRALRNTRETSLAKWHATEHSVQSALDAIQVHGANGYSNEFPVERYLRNSKAAVIYEGTSQLHTLIQADYALGLPRGSAAALRALAGAGVGAHPAVSDERRWTRA